MQIELWKWKPGESKKFMYNISLTVSALHHS